MGIEGALEYFRESDFQKGDELTITADFLFSLEEIISALEKEGNIDLNNEELKATRILNGVDKKKTADEMFEELGYKIMFDNPFMFRYVKCFELKPKRHIIFAIDRTVSVCEENEKELAINRDYFTMQELRSINKKCQELGWI